MKNRLKNREIKAFTLAEVLITLGIIGVVAAITIPILVNNINNTQYKTGYKKAFSEFSQLIAQANGEGILPTRPPAYWDVPTTTEEWAIVSAGFKAVKSCTPAELDQCWAPGELICTGSCTVHSPRVDLGSRSFIDAAGRSWALYAQNEAHYLVDTNGFKGPNKYGKDRWTFGIGDKKAVISVPDDQLTQMYWCESPPCYYRSWLYE